MPRVYTRDCTSFSPEWDAVAIATAPMAWMRKPDPRDGEEVDEGLEAWKDRGQEGHTGWRWL